MASLGEHRNAPSELLRHPQRLLLQRIARPESLLLTLWALQLLRMAWPVPVVEVTGASVAAVYLARVVVLVRWPILILCAVLLGITAVLASFYGGAESIWIGLAATPTFAGFFGTVVLLRATADHLPEITSARRLLERIQPAHRAGGFLVGTHLLAVVLGPGAYAVTAPIVGHETSADRRLDAGRTCHRGACLAALWSPFWIAMAVASQYVPGVPLWQIMALGIPVAAAALMLSHVMFAEDPTLKRLGQALYALRPIAKPVALCVAVVVVLSSVTALPGVQTLIVSMPILCSIALARQGRHAIRTAMHNTYRGTGFLANEIAILTVSLTLGGVLKHALATTGVAATITAYEWPAMAILGLILTAMSAAALIGIHQMVSMTVVLVIFADLPGALTKLVLMESALIGWAFASMIGLSAVSVATATAMFRIPMEKVILGPNLKFVAVMTVATTILLALLNALFV